MKKSIIIIAVTLLVSTACKKLAKEPARPSIEEINAQYEIHYGFVAFHSARGDRYTMITNNSDGIVQGRGTTNVTTCDSVDKRFKYSLKPGVQSYTIYTIKANSNNEPVPDQVLKIGTIDVKEYSCNVVDVD